MLFKKSAAGLACILLAATMLLLCTACAATKGSIVIWEQIDGTGCTMEWKQWSAKNTCELSLHKGDVLQIEIARETGEIALTVSGKNGSEPYTGKNLETGVFTVTISETDAYVLALAGKNTTGSLIAKNLGNPQPKQLLRGGAYGDSAKNSA